MYLSTLFLSTMEANNNWDEMKHYLDDIHISETRNDNLDR